VTPCDIARLSIAVDSASAKTAARDLDKLGGASDAVANKIMNLAKAAVALAGLHSISSAVREVTQLAARYETLGVVMNTAGRNAGYGRMQMEQFEKALRRAGISAMESRQQLATMATANIDLAQSSKLARAAQDLAVVAANGDVVRGVQWLATLDMRTTPMCRALDGKEWSLPNYEPMGHGMPFPGSSAHWNCRSAVLPAMKSFEDLAREAGGDADMARRLDELDRNGDPSLSIGRAQRASKDGEVNANTTYEDWFRGQPRSVQEDIMGPKRLQMFEEGRLNFQTAVDPMGRPLTLGELREKYECHVDPKRFKAWHGPMEEEYGRLMAIHGDIDKVRQNMPSNAFEVKNLPQAIKDALGTSADSLLFSADSLAKQLFRHPEITRAEYVSAINKIKDSTEIYRSYKEYHIMVIAGDSKGHAVILKTTKDGLEAFMVSLHRLNADALKQVRKNERIK
jgi:hypothetical protein